MARRDVVQPDDAGDGRRQCRRDLRVVRIGEADRSVHREIMDVGMKG